MADKKISALTAASTPLAGTEVLPIVQSGATVKVAVASMFGSNVYTFLNTPTSANLAAAVSDETGSGALVFGTNPTFSNTGGNPSANFTNSIYQDVNVNYFTAAGSGGTKIILNFGDNGSTNNIGSFTVYGSAYGAGNDNRMDFGNANGRFGISTAGNGFLTTGNLVIGTSGKGITDSTGGTLLSFTTQRVESNKPIRATSVSTTSGDTASTATATPVTLFAVSSESVWIVNAAITGTGAPAAYTAVAIVKSSGGVAAATPISAATNLTITVSGLNVQATQTSGVSQIMSYSAVRLF